MPSALNCSALATRTGFTAYAHNLLSATDGDLHSLDQCRSEVCAALWGEGNNDVSGIGVRSSRLSSNKLHGVLIYFR